MEQLGSSHPSEGERNINVQGRMRIQAGPGSIEATGSTTVMAVLVAIIIAVIGYQTYSQQTNMTTIIEQHADTNRTLHTLALGQFLTEDDKRHLNVQGQISDLIKQQADAIVKKETQQ